MVAKRHEPNSAHVVYGAQTEPYDVTHVMTVRDEPTGLVITIEDYPSGKNVKVSREWTWRRVLKMAVVAGASGAAGAAMSAVFSRVF
jgi:hypothetical protein